MKSGNSKRKRSAKKQRNWTGKLKNFTNLIVRLCRSKPEPVKKSSKRISRPKLKQESPLSKPLPSPIQKSENLKESNMEPPQLTKEFFNVDDKDRIQADQPRQPLNLNLPDDEREGMEEILKNVLAKPEGSWGVKPK